MPWGGAAASHRTSVVAAGPRPPMLLPLVRGHYLRYLCATHEAARAHAMLLFLRHAVELKRCDAGHASIVMPMNQCVMHTILHAVMQVSALMVCRALRRHPPARRRSPRGAPPPCALPPSRGCGASLVLQLRPLGPHQLAPPLDPARPPGGASGATACSALGPARLPWRGSRRGAGANVSVYSSTVILIFEANTFTNSVCAAASVPLTGAGGSCDDPTAAPHVHR